MEVTVLASTDKPERLVCQCARGDYFDGYVGDKEYAELMKSIDYDDEDVAEVVDILKPPEEKMSSDEAKLEAQTKSFIEKQLSRGHYGRLKTTSRKTYIPTERLK